MGIDDILRIKRTAILKIADRHGATNIRVFGSVAAGTARLDSDVDLLVDAGPKRTPFFPGGFISDLEELLGRKVDVVTEKSLHWYIRDRVLKEAVPL